MVVAPETDWKRGLSATPCSPPGSPTHVPINAGPWWAVPTRPPRRGLASIECRSGLARDVGDVALCLPPQAAPIPPLGRDASSAGLHDAPGNVGAKVGVGERVLARLFEQHPPVRNVVRKLARLDVGGRTRQPRARGLTRRLVDRPLATDLTPKDLRAIWTAPLRRLTEWLAWSADCGFDPRSAVRTGVFLAVVSRGAHDSGT